MPHCPRRRRHGHIKPLSFVQDPQADQSHKLLFGSRQLPTPEQPLDDPINGQCVVKQVILNIEVRVVVTEAITPRIYINPPCLPYNLRQASVVRYLKPRTDC